MSEAAHTVRKWDWGIISGLVVIHVLAVGLCAFFPSWYGFVSFVVLSIVTGMGVTTGFHRLFTHGSFRTYSVLRFLFALAGTLAAQGPLLKWITDHRRHHESSDQEGDPHSPVQEGFFFAHIVWTMLGIPTEELAKQYRRYGKDILKDWPLMLLNRHYLSLNLLLLALTFLTGLAIDGWWMGMSLLVWGGFLRLVYVYHVTWFVNSATHWWGYRNYHTTDNSRNLWWVGILAFGEGWHNNHHASQTTAFHGFHRWWEFDLSYVLIRTLELFRLVWSVQKKVIHHETT